MPFDFKMNITNLMIPASSNPIKTYREGGGGGGE